MVQQIPIKGFSYATIKGELAIVCKYCQKAWRAERIEVKENRQWLMQHRLDHLDDTIKPFATGAEDDPY